MGALLSRRLQRMCEEGKKGKVQRSAEDRDGEPGLDVDRAVDVAGRGGESLPDSVRSIFEPKFGHDFSQVRVHRDAEAAGAARAVQARAYTIGRDIVFGAGEYSPSTHEGQRLLAHELTHVVQQGEAAPSGALQREAQPAEAAAPTPADRELDDVIAALERRAGTATQAEEGQSPAATLHSLREVRSGGTEAQKAEVLKKIHEAAEQQKAKATAAGGQAAGAAATAAESEMQRKGLDVSEPGDELEREADRVAARVVDGHAAAGPVTPAGPGSAQAKRIQRQAEAGALILVEAGPIGWAILGAIAIGVVVYAATRTCPPCPAPPSPEIDRVPPSTPHFPCPGDHWHYYVYNQNPMTCTCYGPRRLFGGCCGMGGAGAPC